jgi:guanylate kinase
LSRPGRLVVISGPSGVGKSTLIQRIIRREKCRLAVSATTRQPRPGEADGVHYHFLSEPEFAARCDRGEFLETAVVHGARYGTPRSEVAPWLERGWTVILDVDTQGFRAIRKVMPVTGVIVMPPTLECLDSRLKARNTEDAEALARRLKNAHGELAAADEYDYRVVNDDVDRATKTLEDIIGLGPVATGPGRKAD